MVRQWSATPVSTGSNPVCASPKGLRNCLFLGFFLVRKNLRITDLYIAETHIKYSLFHNFREISLHRFFLHDKIKSESGFIMAENKSSKVMQDYEKVNRLIDGLTLFDDDLWTQHYPGCICNG